MSSPSPKVGEQLELQTQDLDQLIEVLKNNNYRVIGPTVRASGIVYDDVSSKDDFPTGWTDEQSPGKYRLIQRHDSALFGYSAGPQSWKKFLQPSSVRLWHAQRENSSSAAAAGRNFHIVEDQPEVEKFAFVGVRACDLHAIAIQDRVFLEGVYVDPGYKARREKTFVVVVNCTQAGSNCFCASMGAGPKADSGFDLAFTEVLDGGRHILLVEVGTEKGAAILSEVPHSEASSEDKDAGAKAISKTAADMGQRLDTSTLKETLYHSYDSPRWGEVAKRCLACSNCTLACPTCFCTTIEDTSDLTGENAERWRKWDSCFTLDFSYIHGGSIRSSIASRYRQWLIHKLATWVDQFGTFGCVGCGRCITWCPVGIDITEEARALQATAKI
jgi:sulfhydrogenase subunit beta (sulfur reductase)